MNWQALTGEVKRLEALVALALARSRTGGSLGTSENFTGITSIGVGSIHTQTQSAANPVALAAVAVKVARTGLFDGRIHCGFQSDTTGKLTEHRAVFVPITAAVATRFTQGADPGVRLCAGEAPPNTNWGASSSADAAGVTAAGLLFNGTAPTRLSAGAVQLNGRVVPSLTGLLNVQTTGGANQFDWTGQCGYTAAGQPIFTPAQIAAGAFGLLVLELEANAGADVVHYASLSMDFREIG